MENHRLPAKAYKMLLNLANRGKINWVSRVRDILTINGFFYVWENQGVGCVKWFIKVFKQRLIDCRWQNWNSHINSSNRFLEYSKFKSCHQIEPYLMLDLNRYVRYALTKFRLEVSDIMVHR